MKILFLLFLLLLSGNLFISAQETGFLTFDLNVDSVSIIINNDFFEARKIASTDSIALNDGLHLINISVPNDNYFERYQRVKAGETSTISHEFEEKAFTEQVLFRNNAARRYLDSDVIIVSDSDSDIFVGDSIMGTGIALISQNTGIKNYTVRNPKFGSKSFDITRSNSVFISYQSFYLRPEENKARIFSFIPGVSQFYKRQFKKGIIFSLSTAAIATFYFSKTQEYSDEEAIFLELRERYNSTTNENLAFVLGNEAEEQHDLIKKLDTQRKLLLSSALLVYAYNIFDGFKSLPTGGYKEEKPLEFYLNTNHEFSESFTSATLRFNLAQK